MENHGMKSIDIIKTPLEDWIGHKILKQPGQLTAEKLTVYQMEAIRCILAYVREYSPFYRELLAEIKPENMDSLKSFEQIPFTTAEDLRNQGSRMVCTKQSDIHRIVTLDTSGTTGIPKRIHYTKEDQELTIDFFRHGMSTFTEPGDKVLVLLPGQTPGSIGDLLKIGLARMGAEAVVYGIVDDVDKVMDIICDQGITGIVGIPQQLFALSGTERSETVSKAGMLKNVLLSTDHVSPAVSGQIKASWGCQVYEHYGMTEMGLGGGVFCRSCSGYHLREADLYFEIIDPKTGRQVPPGTFGEVVFTTLTRKGMPLIRYRTGDISRFLEEPCPCGTVLKTMDRVSHRLASEVRLNNGRILTMPILEDMIFRIKGVTDFDGEISTSGHGEILTIFVSGTGTLEQMAIEITASFGKTGFAEMIKSGELKLAIEKQDIKVPDIKAIRKRDLKDNRT